MYFFIFIKIYQKKKTLVLDLDETLIHCHECKNSPSDIVLPIQFPTGELIQVYLFNNNLGWYKYQTILYRIYLRII